MDEADTELVLISAYLVPTEDLAGAIRRAEERGVSVRILTNSLRSNNHTAAHSAYRRYVHQLVSSGADLHEVRALAKDRSKYMLSPVDDKELGLHAKAILIDEDKSFVGSANLDPRSLQLNTEMGLLIHSEAFNRSLREALDIDFHPRNAWHLQETDAGKLRWVADDQTLDAQPAASRLQRLEDWFLSKLPIGKEM
jgi:putative cardiolipin synthase